jgi:hypothetical protein
VKEPQRGGVLTIVSKSINTLATLCVIGVFAVADPSIDAKALAQGESAPTEQVERHRLLIEELERAGQLARSPASDENTQLLIEHLERAEQLARSTRSKALYKYIRLLIEELERGEIEPKQTWVAKVRLKEPPESPITIKFPKVKFNFSKTGRIFKIEGPEIDLVEWAKGAGKLVKWASWTGAGGGIAVCLLEEGSLKNCILGIRRFRAETGTRLGPPDAHVGAPGSPDFGVTTENGH